MNAAPYSLSRTAYHQDWAQFAGALATRCLHLEVDTHPKPGMVSHVDNGAHADMNAALLHHSAEVLAPFFVELSAAGWRGANMNQLRHIGIAAEQAMLAATDGVNTHRGAIFGLGLLLAAAGFRANRCLQKSLGQIVAEQWGGSILSGPVLLHSHGTRAALRYGVGGARHEAAQGFPAVYRVGIPALTEGQQLAPHNDEAARVHACMALIAAVNDTNLLHRGGQEGLDFARSMAAAFLQAGGVGFSDWKILASRIHHQFIERRLSPGGCADLLAMTLFVHALRQVELSP